MAKQTFNIVLLLFITPMMEGVETKSPEKMLEQVLDKVTGVQLEAPAMGAVSGIVTGIQDELQAVEQRVSILDPNILFHVAVGLAALEGCKMMWRYVSTPRDQIYNHAAEEMNPPWKKNADSALSKLPAIDHVATKEEVDAKLGGVKTYFAGLAADHNTHLDSIDEQIKIIQRRLLIVEDGVVAAVQDIATLKEADLQNTQGLASAMAILNGADKKLGIVQRYEASTKDLTAKIVALQEVDSKFESRLQVNVVSLQNHNILVDKKLADHDGKFEAHDKKFEAHEAAYKKLDGHIRRVASESNINLDVKGGVLGFLHKNNKDSGHNNNNNQQQQQQQQSNNNNNNNAGASSGDTL